jgi:Tfp pilus assembly protein PilX
VPIQTPRRRRRRDRGFSLLIVFMLMIVMVGAAATVILSTQQDLSVAGGDREALQSFYAAEYAIAVAKDYIAGNATALWSSGTGWTPLLRSGIKEICDTNSDPITTNTWNEFKGSTFYTSGLTAGPKVQYRWCVRNDPSDIAYVDTSVLSSGETANTTDSYDSSHQIEIHGFGQIVNGSSPALASSEVWILTGGPKGTIVVPDNCYSQEGGCGGHESNSGSSEAAITVIGTGGVSTSVKGL